MATKQVLCLLDGCWLPVAAIASAEFQTETLPNFSAKHSTPTDIPKVGN